VRERFHIQAPLENPSVQTHLVLLCCKRLCIFGPQDAIQMCRYYYYYYLKREDTSKVSTEEQGVAVRGVKI